MAKSGNERTELEVNWDGSVLFSLGTQLGMKFMQLLLSEISPFFLWGR